MTTARNKPAPIQEKLIEEQVRVLIVSRAILRATHDYFAPYYRARVETACFWFGIDGAQFQVATTVGVPKLYQTRGNYRVEKTSQIRLAAEMRRQGLTNLAQIHTHPLNWGVEHSRYDDEHTYSTKNGSLSLIWADYGLQMRHDSLSGIGVHERRDGEWLLLEEREVSERIRVIDDFADFRWEIESGGIGYAE